MFGGHFVTPMQWDIVYVIDKPPPKMFTGNTCDSSGINPEGEARGFISELLSVLLVNTDGGLFDWFVPLQAAYKLLSCFSPLLCSLFQPNWNAPPSNFWQRISHTVGCIPANKPSIVSCFSRALTVFYSPACNAQSSKF